MGPTLWSWQVAMRMMWYASFFFFISTSQWQLRWELDYSHIKLFTFVKYGDLSNYVLLLVR